MFGALARLLTALGMSAETAGAVANFVRLGTIIYLLKKILELLFKAFRTPMFLGVLVLALTFFPDTIGWIFIKIGEIELRVMAIMLSQIMPEIFSAGWTDYSSWADLWQTGLNALPADMVDVINGLGVAQLLGMITSTIGAVGAIHIYRRCMIRAGLL